MHNLEKIRKALPRNKSKTPKRSRVSRTPKRRVVNKRTPRRQYDWRFNKENNKQSVTPIRLNNRERTNLKRELSKIITSKSKFKRPKFSNNSKLSFTKGKRSPKGRSPKQLRVYKNSKQNSIKDVTNMDSGIFHDYFNRKKHKIPKKKEKFDRPRTCQQPAVTQRIKEKIHKGYAKILKCVTPTNDLGRNFIFP